MNRSDYPDSAFLYVSSDGNTRLFRVNDAQGNFDPEGFENTLGLVDSWCYKTSAEKISTQRNLFTAARRLPENFGFKFFRASLGPHHSVGQKESPSSDAQPPQGQGEARLIYDEKRRRLTYFIEFDNLTSEEVPGHIHSGYTSEDGPALISLPLGKVKFGQVEISSEMEEMLMHGNLYVNIHSEVHPDGEIRGQIAPFRQVLATEQDMEDTEDTEEESEETEVSEETEATLPTSRDVPREEVEAEEKNRIYSQERLDELESKLITAIESKLETLVPEKSDSVSSQDQLDLMQFELNKFNTPDKMREFGQGMHRGATAGPVVVVDTFVDMSGKTIKMQGGGTIKFSVSAETNEFTLMVNEEKVTARITEVAKFGSTHFFALETEREDGTVGFVGMDVMMDSDDKATAIRLLDTSAISDIEDVLAFVKGL